MKSPIYQEKITSVQVLFLPWVCWENLSESFLLSFYFVNVEDSDWMAWGLGYSHPWLIGVPDSTMKSKCEIVLDPCEERQERNQNFTLCFLLNLNRLSGGTCHNSWEPSRLMISASSQPRDQTQVSRIVGGFLTSWATGKPKNTGVGSLSLLQQIFLTQESNRGLLHCR